MKRYQPTTYRGLYIEQQLEAVRADVRVLRTKDEPELLALVEDVRDIWKAARAIEFQTQSEGAAV